MSQAGGANDAIDENDDNEGSPPPYSELDPLANNRPNSLDLSGDLNETSGKRKKLKTSRTEIQLILNNLIFRGRGIRGSRCNPSQSRHKMEMGSLIFFL